MWLKAWLDTRWRFLAGLALLLCMSIGVVLVYPEIQKLLPQARAMSDDTALGREIREAADMQASFRGYVWSQWFSQELSRLAALFAILLGVGGPYAPRGGALFTLSLPVARTRAFLMRAAIGLAETFALVLVPSLAIPFVAPAVGAQYALADVLIHGGGVFVGCATFFSLALLLSTVFEDFWPPALIAIVVAMTLGMLGQTPALSDLNFYRVMAAHSYFETGDLPWAAFAVSLIASAAMLYFAALRTKARDF